MVSKPLRHYQPTSSEVIAWRAFAELARAVGEGRSRQWPTLKDQAIKARKLMVFGPESPGNVCVRLIEQAIMACESFSPASHHDELVRLAAEVERRCDGWAVIRIGEAARG